MPDGDVSAIFAPQLAIIKEAAKRVPIVAFALAAVAFAAAASLIVKMLGHGQAAIIIFAATFVAAVLIYAFSTVIASANPRTTLPGTILVYAVTAFFVIFLAFTVTAFAFLWPPALAQAYGLVTPPTPPPPSPPIRSTQQFGPMRIGPGETRAQHVTATHPGPVVVDLESIVPDWTGHEAQRDKAKTDGTGLTPELLISVCPASKLTECPSPQQVGVKRALSFEIDAGVINVEFINFTINPAIEFTAEIEYPG